MKIYYGYINVKKIDKKIGKNTFLKKIYTKSVDYFTAQGQYVCGGIEVAGLYTYNYGSGYCLALM